MSAGDPAAVERELLMYAERARAKGLDMVWGAFEDDSGGVCVLGAYNRTARHGEGLSLPTGDAHAAAWDSIEMGFDGEPPCLPTVWWEVGSRLRGALKPRRAVAQ